MVIVKFLTGHYSQQLLLNNLEWRGINTNVEMGQTTAPKLPDWYIKHRSAVGVDVLIHISKYES
ncbi:hypothetical protein [Rubellicoccus peritrichatus]|uniref:Uncharacterized protein n=1 Tax=Rubellicoccus peritrichatus TaxID=3080537 RepID=A0AAQ3L7G0_9BACT|nr:hypothetical protein [Puniceicoccus sp. CR14]WOO41009.1 hypothetical protein RZN69_20510 [Puniceicoccus sp. CR14]